MSDLNVDRAEVPDLPGLFVVGTDTGVGKTYVAAAITRTLAGEGRKVAVLKPIATGAVFGDDDVDGPRVDDADRLIAAVGGWWGRISRREVCPIAFAEPLAPPVAARRAGRALTFDEVENATIGTIQLWRERGAEILVVEGVGGLLCPLTDGTTLVDLAVRLDYPLVVVARRGLGTLNHTLLTLDAALGRGLRVAGVVLNGSEPTTDPVAEATNPGELSRRIGAIPILAELPRDPDGFTPVVMDGVDWYNRASRPRLSLSRTRFEVAPDVI